MQFWIKISGDKAKTGDIVVTPEKSFIVESSTSLNNGSGFTPGEIHWQGDNLSLNQIKQIKQLDRMGQQQAFEMARLMGQPMTVLQLLKEFPEASKLLSEDGNVDKLLDAVNTSEQRNRINNAVLDSPELLDTMADQEDVQRNLDYKKAEILWGLFPDTLKLIESVPGAFNLSGTGFIEILLKNTADMLSGEVKNEPIPKKVSKEKQP